MIPVFVIVMIVIVSVTVRVILLVIVLMFRHSSIPIFVIPESVIPTRASRLKPRAYFPFAIPSMISHCSSVSFMIDKRALRTRSKFFNFGCAFTSASVTGFGKARTASISTTNSLGSSSSGFG